ncbi:MAG TPA: hypothetical protein VG890_17960 [Puia sp.]|nr:hypothetical protein [Puia sp.]
MSSHVQRGPLSNALLTGLAGGLTSTVLCLFYNIFYRLASNYPSSEVINVSSIIFVTNVIFLVIGLIYYFISQSSPRGNLIYLVLMFLLIVVLLWLAAGSNVSPDPKLAHGFRGLIIGIIVIMGINALLIPYLVNKQWFAEFFL